VWILALLAAVALAGAGLKLYGMGETAGFDKCHAAVAEADAKLAAKSDELKQEAQNHIEDMGTAYDAGEKAKSARVIYRTAKGAADVRANPVFANPTCVLPAESLRNLNAARASFRTEQPDATEPASNAPVAAPTPPPASSTTPAPLAAPAARLPRGKH
jgi:hypothetical protein